MTATTEELKQLTKLEKACEYIWGEIEPSHAAIQLLVSQLDEEVETATETQLAIHSCVMAVSMELSLRRMRKALIT